MCVYLSGTVPSEHTTSVAGTKVFQNEFLAIAFHSAAVNLIGLPWDTVEIQFQFFGRTSTVNEAFPLSPQ